MTVKELREILNDYPDHTPVVVDSGVVSGTAVALELYPVETTLDDKVLLLQTDDSRRINFRDL